MPRRRATLLLVLVAAACSRTDRATPASGGASNVVVDSTPVSVSGDWPAELGSALVIPADTENLAVILYPASLAATVDAQAEVVLLAANGDAFRLKTARSGVDSVHCGDAPMLRFARGVPLTWSLGVSGSKATALKSDSLDAFSHEDSVFYSTEGARLASAVPAGPSSRHRGLPFSLVAVRRLQFGDTAIIAAQLVRRVNQEANPAEERTLVVAERVASGPLTTVHSDRSEGTEETAAHFDLIGSFRAGPALYLVIATDSPSGSTIEILERSGGAWRVRWTRSIAC